MFKITIKTKLLLLREAFLALLPVVLIMNSLVMLCGLIRLLNSWGIPIPDLGGNTVSRLYYFLIPLFVSLSLSTLLAKEKSLDPIGTLLIAMVCFLRGTDFLTIDSDAQITSHHGDVLTSIVVTWLAVWLLHYFSTKSRLQLVKEQGPCPEDLSPRLISALNLIGPGLLTVLCIELLRQTPGLLVGLNPLVARQLRQIQPIPELILYKVISLCTWAIGLHGDHTASGIFRSLYNTPTGEPIAIQLKTFHAIFMNMGGAGATLPIPFIILFSKRLSRFRAIAKISLPFTLFNINETLLFGLPILLNPIFLVPFLSTAFVNMAIALTAIQLNLFTISPQPVHWMLPSIYKAYVASNGSLWAVLTQLICIVTSGCIYYPFLVIASQRDKAPQSLSRLFADRAAHRHKRGQVYSGRHINVEISSGNFLTEAVNQYQETAFVTQQRARIKDTETCQIVLNQLSEGRFLLYFQPKVNARTLETVGLEALLRFQTPAGKILPPTFLPTLYRQGLSKAVDKKVVELIFNELRRWRANGIVIPTIALNFDKDFLLDPEAVKAFIRRAEQFNTQFCIEITEHTYTKEHKALAAVTHRIRTAGHRISIDDFGSGYSSLTSLVSLEADEIKLDRALSVLSNQEPERGTLLLSASIQLCHDLGFSVVAEGIETENQLYLTQRCAVDIVQGYYLARPMSAQQVAQYLLKTTCPKSA